MCICVRARMRLCVSERFFFVSPCVCAYQSAFLPACCMIVEHIVARTDEELKKIVQTIYVHICAHL